MEIDHDRIDEAVLALLWLTLHDERRAWKGFDWNALDRLFRKGLICGWCPGHFALFTHATAAP
jgi:hypothetical protein